MFLVINIIRYILRNENINETIDETFNETRNEKNYIDILYIIIMITKEDFMNMILSHPANVTKKWKLHPMKKTELKELWAELCDSDINEGDILYSDHELTDDDNDEVADTVDEIYNIIVNDSDNDEEKEKPKDNTITMKELTKQINLLKMEFRNNYKKNKTNINVYVSGIDDKINDILDKCIDCTKDKEQEILINFEDYINRYL